MYKRTVFILLLSMNILKSFSQTESVPSLSFSKLGPAYEYSLGKNMSSKMQLGFFTIPKTVIYLPLGADMQSYADTYFFFQPGGNLSLRSYYNFKRRTRLGKNTSRNSANYFALVGMYLMNPLYTLSQDCMCRDFYSDDLSMDGLSTGFVWGMQRNYKSRFNFDFNVGFMNNYRDQLFDLYASTSLGIWLGSRK
jgi:hypothetical protein